MLQTVSRLVLSLSALLSAAPADTCLLKLTGLCCQYSSAEKSNCASCGTQTCSRQQSKTPCDDSNGKRPSCCAFTPASGVISPADAPAIVDVFTDSPPLSLLNLSQEILASLESSLRQSVWLSVHLSPQSSDTPLFLRTHSFLI